MPRTPLELIDALGFGSEISTSELTSRRKPFDCLHVGTKDIEIGKILDLIKNDGALLPPRTGHLGNWENIVRGRSGALDFNNAICSNGHGYPLIYCFTQTEAEKSNSGDWVYLPGSILNGDTRSPLRVFSWDGTCDVERSRDQSYFCPFVKTETDGNLVPLVQFHWQRMKSISNFHFALEAQVIWNHASEVIEMVTVLIEDALCRENPRRHFQDIISHSVSKLGTVNRCEIRGSGSGLFLDDCFYESAHALAESALIPFRAVADSSGFFSSINSFPRLMPVLSHLSVGVFTAIFETHYPDLVNSGMGVKSPFVAHFHWGARDMAGFPPHRKGYFIERSTQRSLRGICEVLLGNFPLVNPLCFVLLPAAVFMLCPDSTHSRDAELLGELFKSLKESRSRRKIEKPEQEAQTIEQGVNEWIFQNLPKLSPYFLSRFQSRSGVLQAADRPEFSKPIEPEHFHDLSWKEACTIVGVLTQYISAKGTT